MQLNQDCEKKFVCYWGDGYIFNEAQIVYARFFTEKLGYSNNDILDIMILDYGEVWQSRFMQEEHYVLRVKEDG